MSYVSDVEGILGTELSPTWCKVAEALEAWKCSPFHAAVIIHWMMHGRLGHDQALRELQELAESSAKRDHKITLELQRLKRKISKSAQSPDWLDILRAAQEAGLSAQQISALFEGFLDGLVLPQAVSDPAAALSAIQQSHSKYRI